MSNLHCRSASPSSPGLSFTGLLPSTACQSSFVLSAGEGGGRGCGLIPDSSWAVCSAGGVWQFLLEVILTGVISPQWPAGSQGSSAVLSVPQHRWHCAQAVLLLRTGAGSVCQPGCQQRTAQSQGVPGALQCSCRDSPELLGSDGSSTGTCVPCTGTLPAAALSAGSALGAAAKAAPGVRHPWLRGQQESQGCLTEGVSELHRTAA